MRALKRNGGCCCHCGERCRCKVLLAGAAVRDMCTLGWACWCRVPLQGVAAGCCLKVSGVCAFERACSCRPRRHAAAACCLKVLLSEWCVRFGVARITLKQHPPPPACRSKAPLCTFNPAPAPSSSTVQRLPAPPPTWLLQVPVTQVLLILLQRYTPL